MSLRARAQGYTQGLALTVHGIAALHVLNNRDAFISVMEVMFVDLHVPSRMRAIISNLRGLNLTPFMMSGPFLGAGSRHVDDGCCRHLEDSTRHFSVSYIFYISRLVA